MRLYVTPSRTIDAFGSTGVEMDFLPPLTDAASTSVNVAHVAAGGTLGRHPAVRRQVFAVVVGTGEVQVDDEPRRPVGPGTLVVWEPGETHQTWATTDLTAVVVETSGALDLSPHFRELAL
ncbi:cupin domain-containing protein [Cellulomonas sp.]|uniref:cupin domain-containing protein n=1 Tax=Cellulomonas sp. TaxID=40001 RepID=UPI001B09D14B|nr:cupin domain-containing protein [Cellulomonas sp.]MBO9553442.1 cupin domain-containing protein [Cellulomonas sp.]